MSGTSDTRLIAFYLPQFHPIPENSRWWGPGFTDWNNVVRARPLFPGHRQPRLPRDLGFYDLRLASTREAQARLARENGIHGFCYYTYWFKNSARLLEGPLEAVLRDGTPDFPFCVCWANENWTRSWDGSATDVLMEQLHDHANNAAFFDGMLPYFNDPRYIRIDDRPLLLIYRATLFPDVAATLAHWRAHAQQLGMAPPYVVAVEFFDVNAELMVAKGFDAVCEFPPIMPGSDQSEVEVAMTGMAPEFHGRLLDYERLAQWFLRRPETKYHRFKGVTLGWDNTARRGAEATVLVNFSLECYRDWLREAIAQTKRTKPPAQRLLFINAWNEWAEGAYLEPDQHNGLAYLEVTRSALLEPTVQVSGLPALAIGAIPAGDGAAAASVAQATNSRPTVPALARAASSSLRVVGISCVGNEADIVEAFVRHNLAFFDHLLILEHNTLDGTREILARLVAEGLPISVEHSAEPQFRQVLFTNYLLRSALVGQQTDWVFPIDCDEFLLVPTRADLDAALIAAGEAHLRMKWVIYVPSPGDDHDEPHPLRRIRNCYDYPAPSVDDNPWVWKVAVNARLLGDYYLDRYEICRGNHFLSLPNEQRPSSVPMLPQDDICLAHFPVRSVDQMAIKSTLGVLSGLGAAGRFESYGKILKEITSGAVDTAALAHLTRDCLDTGRHTSEALKDTPTKFAPLPVTAPLSYDRYRLPALGVILKWIELNLLDDEARRDAMMAVSGGGITRANGATIDLRPNGATAK